MIYVIKKDDNCLRQSLNLKIVNILIIWTKNKMTLIIIYLKWFEDGEEHSLLNFILKETARRQLQAMLLKEAPDTEKLISGRGNI
jgi:hypothetical protein